MSAGCTRPPPSPHTRVWKELMSVDRCYCLIQELQFVKSFKGLLCCTSSECLRFTQRVHARSHTHFNIYFPKNWALKQINCKGRRERIRRRNTCSHSPVLFFLSICFLLSPLLSTLTPGVTRLHVTFPLLDWLRPLSSESREQNCDIRYKLVADSQNLTFRKLFGRQMFCHSCW